MPANANGLPYPAATDTPDVPRDIKALADALPVQRVPTAMAAGFVTVTIAAGSTNGSAAVTFPVGRFATAPRVFPCVNNAGNNWAVAVGSITASGCTVYLRHVDASTAGATANVSWFAVEGLG